MSVKLYGMGNWTLFERETSYFGELYLNEDEGLIYLYYRLMHDGPIKSYLELPIEIECTIGTLMNGAKLTLLNGKRVSTQSYIGTEDAFGYIFDYMLEGIQFKALKEILFSKMIVNIPTLLKWGTITNYTKPEVGESDKLVGVKDVEPINIYEDNELSIEYNVSFSDPFFKLATLEEEIILRQTPFLIIESRTGLKELDFFISHLKTLLGTIEIAVGRKLPINIINVYNPNHYFLAGDKKVEMEVNVVHKFMMPNNNISKDNRIDELNYLFSLKDLTNRALFESWFKKYELLKPVIELYLETIHKGNMSEARLFLNLSQALETYHSRMVCSGGIREFFERIEDVISIRPGAYKKDDRKYLRANSRKFITFRSRIADLIMADFEFHFYLGELSYLEFPKVITDTRNYYTHYNKKLENNALSGVELLDACRIMSYILEYYLLKEIGFNNEFIHERIRKRWKNLSTTISIRKASKDLHK